MSYSIQLQKSLRTFDVNQDESILSAAQRNNIALSYGCRNGTCGSCKAKIIEGQFFQKKHAPSALSSDEINKNIALLCCTEAKSNLKILAHELVCIEGQKIQKISGKIKEIKKLTSDVIRIELNLPEQHRIFNFLPGQYIELMLPKGIRRAYSIGNLAKNGILELHIRHLKGGIFTDWLFQSGKVGDILRFEGPLGNFFLRASNKPVIFLASGTGFSPIKSIIESAIENNSHRPMILYWGGRSRKDIYMMELASSWQEKLSNFIFIPVLSEPLPGDAWKGKTGLVHQAIIEDFTDLSNFEIYACGIPVMVESAKRDFTINHFLPETAFFADAFTTEAEKD